MSTLLLVLLLLAVPVFAGSPQLNTILPRGGQRGTEVNVSLHGPRLNDAVGLLFYRPGLELVEITETKGNRVAAKLRIAADAPIGEHPLRVRTASGLSDLATFYVGPYPSVEEAEPNSDFEQPQTVALNSTVHGLVQNEDVDYYLVEATKGQRISVEIEGMRLGGGLVDLYAAILNPARFELATSDDSALLLQDPVASIIASEDGQYVIQVRDSAYGGSGNHRYRLHVGAFPRPLVAYPAGGKAGGAVTVQLLGDPAGPIEHTLTLPERPTDRHKVFVEREGLSTPSPNVLRVSPFDDVMEAEPNDRRPQATATDLDLPLAFNGIIEKEGDHDWFRFKARQGQTYDFRVHARSIRSPLDPVLNVYEAGGKHLQGNDDAGGSQDSHLRWQAPADGEYELRVRDHLDSGGPTYVYRVEVTSQTPSLGLTMPSFARNRQDRQHVAVPQGNRYATLINLQREHFGGPVVFSAANLPAGVTMLTPWNTNLGQVPVVFEAAADAPLAGQLVDLRGKHEETGVEGGFRLGVDLVLGPPNNTVYYSTAVDKLPVAVTQAVPFAIEVEPPAVPLVQHGNMQLKVTAQRQEGFDGPITLHMLWNPPGVSSAPAVTIEKGQDHAMYPLNADGSAQPGKWEIVVVAHANAGGGPVWVSSKLTPLKVATPWVTMELAMAVAEQGQPATMVATVTTHTPFEGKATAQLVGLPAHAASEPIEFTKDDTELAFTITTDARTPAGSHRAVFAAVTVPKDGVPIAHNVGQGGVLRVDPPPPPKPDEPEVAAEPEPKPEPQPEPEKPTEKPLSRLEKLRLEAEQRRAGE